MRSLRHPAQTPLHLLLVEAPKHAPKLIVLFVGCGGQELEDDTFSLLLWRNILGHRDKVIGIDVTDRVRVLHLRVKRLRAGRLLCHRILKCLVVILLMDQIMGVLRVIKDNVLVVLELARRALFFSAMFEQFCGDAGHEWLTVPVAAQAARVLLLHRQAPVLIHVHRKIHAA